MVFHVLREADLIARLVVVVPNRALLRQWRNALRDLGVSLDSQPQDGVVEHADADGIVVTYHALAKEHGTAARLPPGPRSARRWSCSTKCTTFPRMPLGHSRAAHGPAGRR